MLLIPWLNSLKSRRSPLAYRRRHVERTAQAVQVGNLEYLEDRTLLSTGPLLVSVIPNGQLDLLPQQNANQPPILHQAPRDLTFGFSPQQSIDPISIDS